LLNLLGFKQLESDTAVFYNAQRLTFIVSHVDDCLLIGPSSRYIRTLKKDIAKVYEIQDLGPAKVFLGIQIIRDRVAKTLKLHQSHYIASAIEKFQLASLRPAYTPLPCNTIKDITPSKILNPKGINLYQQLIGTAIYTLVQTRPDIAFSVQWLSRQNQKPTERHLRYTRRLLKYLDTMGDLAITYTAGTNLEPKVYSNSDWGGCPETGMSTWGYLVTLAGGATSWKAKKAITVALSSAEAEFIGLSEATREI
jgi:hypothetical protein